MIKSPCNKVCKLNIITKLCIGCQRTEYEIFNWSNFDNIKKREIILKINKRKQLSLNPKSNLVLQLNKNNI
tara:strand:+ start:5527 stop:5739 length:213 start_codon:yes stop_codon:yes gene_type:complete